MLTLPPCIAHRGTRVLAPENTMAAFRTAHQQGLSWLECDLQLTRDGEVVIFHDETLERTTNGVGKLSDWDSDKLAKLDAGGWFKDIFRSERIPTLTQLLLFAKVSHMGINFELKPAGASTDMLVMKVLEALVLNPMPPEHVLFSSFAMPALTLLRHYDANVQLGVLYDKWDKSWRETASCLRASAVICNHRLLTPRRVQAIHEAGFLSLAYTVNRLSRFDRLRSWGVDAIFIDDPRMLTR